MLAHTLDTLTISGANALAEVMGAAISGSKVAFLNEDGNADYGVARSLGDENGCNAGSIDVREMFLRVTMLSGVERFEPVLDLMNGLHKTFFANVS